MKKRYVAGTVTAGVIISACVIALFLGLSPHPLEEEGGVYLEDVYFIVDGVTYHFEDITTWRVIISEKYLIIGDTLYGNFTYGMTLFQSWNLVSWPVDKNVSKADITVIYLGELYTWDEACDSIIIAPFVFRYDAVLKTYVLTDVFQPYMGYWVYSHHDEVMIWTT